MKRSVNEIDDRRVVVIGGGPAGLTASYQLSKAGIESIVLEKDETVGGISRTSNYKNYYFDIGMIGIDVAIENLNKLMGRHTSTNCSSSWLLSNFKCIHLVNPFTTRALICDYVNFYV